MRATAGEAPDAAVVKGDLRMVKVLRAAVRDRQRVPRGGLEVTAGGLTLSEAAELLGTDDSAEKAMRRAAMREQREEETYAQEVLEITGLAGEGVLDAAAVAGRHRDTGPALTTAEREFAAGVARVVAGELTGITAPGEGRLAVIAPRARLAALAAAIPEAVPGDRPEALDSRAVLLSVAQAKGLEFDRVVLADPAGILAGSPQGGHDLYVAITRATHRLAVVYQGDLPPLLDTLRPPAAAG